jgi:hypothetical protein
MRPFILLFTALAGATIAGCYMSSGLVDNPNNGADSGTSSGDPTGVPCDVQTVLSHACQSCHGAPPSGNAPNSLVSYADLTAPSKMDPSKSEIQLGVERMQAGTMPPGGGASASDITTLQNWVNAGTPQGTACTTNTNDPLNSGPTCTSTHMVGYCTNESCAGSGMNPGKPCGSCHGSWIAGTVYPTGHEPDLCNGGQVSGVSVVVTDANGKVATMTVDTMTGNFRSSGRSMVAPYKVKVTSGKGERVMNQTAPNGNCNSCHTQNGTQGAPGRITVPF